MPPKKRSAFTLIELLLVIVILGIIGFITLEAVRQYYEGIYRNSEYTKRAVTADHVLEQLSKYFENAVSASIVNLDQTTVSANTCTLPVANDVNDYTIAFIGVDNDSLRGMWNGTTYLPGWSEDVNISGSTMRGFGVDYTTASTISAALNGGGDLTNSAVYNNSQSAANNGGCSDYRLNDTTTAINLTKYLTITNPITANVLTLNQPLDNGNRKRAYLLRTGYAFRVLSDGNFTMYTNFQPWQGERYDTGSTPQLLARNVAHFYVDYNASDYQGNANLTDRGMVWRLKLCMRGIDANLSESSSSANDICRERRVHVRY